MGSFSKPNRDIKKETELGVSNVRAQKRDGKAYDGKMYFAHITYIVQKYLTIFTYKVNLQAI